MNANEYIADAKAAAETTNAAMAEKFPNYMFNAKYKEGLGPHVSFGFANVASKDEAPNGIILNAKGHMSFMMHLSDNSGRNPDMDVFEIELLTRHFEVKNAGIKFRKIKGKTPAEAMKKLVKWFEKNEEKIASLA